MLMLILIGGQLTTVAVIMKRRICNILAKINRTFRNG